MRETIAIRSAERLDQDPGELQQELLDGLTRDLRYAQTKVDALREDQFFDEVMVAREQHEAYIPGNLDPQNLELKKYEWLVDAWIRYRDHLRGQITKLTNDMLRNGLHERVVRIRESQAALVFQFMELVADEITLSAEQRRALGPAMRTHAAVLDGAKPDPLAIYEGNATEPSYYFVDGKRVEVDDDEEED